MTILVRKNSKPTLLNRSVHENIAYTKACLNDTETVLKDLNTTHNGLNAAEVIKRRAVTGDNSIARPREKTLAQRIFSPFVNPFTIILGVLAVISVITDILIPLMENTPEETDLLKTIIITTMVMVSGLLRYLQESRSGNATVRLLAMITTTAQVRRTDTGIAEVPLKEIVCGDIIRLSAGDMIPADVRIIQAKDLFVSQSALTGESEPLEKTSCVLEKTPDTYTECSNLGFMGSTVISGSATAVVIATGSNTLFGKVAQSLAENKMTTTSFEIGVNSVSWILIRFMLVMVPVIFFANGITKGDWGAAFMFAISVAVGLTPEMLPMIVSSCLAKGALAMSKKKTIVKNLNSIQNFGAIDVLCTDKTGTLTQDQVILERHLDVWGKEDARVLHYGFLVSFYQTGLKSLIDAAIIEKTRGLKSSVSGLQAISTAYHKVDEVPFDFNRRRMSVVLTDDEGTTHMVTKGAVEETLSACSRVEYNGHVETLSAELKNDIMKTATALNNDGMRVIAVARKTYPSSARSFAVADEAGMILIGYLAFMDPPKESVAQAIKTLKSHGVTTKILTGDNDKVTRCVCKQVGLHLDNLLLGAGIDAMDDIELSKAVETTNVFAKLSPDQKDRIVQSLQRNGHTVGFLGDGINDAPALKTADVGISVDTAVDIAKESADVVLLEKDLMVLESGIVEGRVTYANMIKYIKITSSSNFGNMLSVLAASAFLPFLPILSIHLLLLNLIYDISCTAIPWDNVDKEFLKKPRTWDPSSIRRFMLWIGPTSSVFDITTYLLMYFVICPHTASNGLLFHEIPETDASTRLWYIALFQAGWFIESMWSQTLVIHMLRTPKIPFLQSTASAPVTLLTCAGIILLTAIPFTDFGASLGLAQLPFEYFCWLALILVLYMGLATLLKKQYIKRYGELL